MKVLSDIYTYSKDKSTVVFGSNTLSESKKQQEKKEEDKSSWFPKTWKSTTATTTTTTTVSTTNNGWLNKLSLPKFTLPSMSLPKMSLPKMSLPKMSVPSMSLPTMSLPKMSLPTMSLPKMSLPKISLPTISMPKFSLPNITLPKYVFPKLSFPEFLKPSNINAFILKRWEELKCFLLSYVHEMNKLAKKVSTFCVELNCVNRLNDSILNCDYIQFKSNPKYINNPWYQRVYFTARDNVNEFINIKKEKMNYSGSQISSGSDNDDNASYEQSESKLRLEEQRSNSKDSTNDEKYGMKHSQSSKYSNDMNNIRTVKKLKKTNTQDLKNAEQHSSFSIKNAHVFSMFSKSDMDNKSVNESNANIDKSDSLYIDAQEEKVEEIVDNKNTEEVKTNEPINESNDTNTNTEKSKFNIKNTWDKFSKIIS